MPDYLGKDQRKTKDDDTKDDKPIQGTYFAVKQSFWHEAFIGKTFENIMHMEENAHCQLQLSNFTLSSFVSPVLDEGDIEILKTYVSFTF